MKLLRSIVGSSAVAAALTAFLLVAWPGPIGADGGCSVGSETYCSCTDVEERYSTPDCIYDCTLSGICTWSEYNCSRECTCEGVGPGCETPE